MEENGLPRCRCRQAALEPVSANAHSAFWQGIEPVSLRDNGSGGVAKQATRVRTAWDERGWRVLFEVEDARAWATLTERDAPLWTEEAVEVFFDPAGDLEGYFELVINSLGTVADLVLRRTVSGIRKDFSWWIEDLESRAILTETGWCAELAIPFASLGAGAQPKAGSQWRVNFLRIDRPGGPGSESVLDAWSPTRVRNFHRPDKFGFVEFIAG